MYLRGLASHVNLRLGYKSTSLLQYIIIYELKDFTVQALGVGGAALLSLLWGGG
jgi:hypothetical protein